MRLLRLGAAIAFCVVSLGCSTGFNRQALDADLAGGAQSEPYQVVVEGDSKTIVADDIRRARELKSQLKFPFRLAVALQSPAGQGDWRWSVKDKETMALWGESLKNRGIVSDLFVMSELVERNSSRAAIRLAAAKHGADAVLIIRAASQLDSYTNPSALLYLTIAGLYFVPGNHVDALLMMRGGVWDVGNEYLYASVESEGEGSTFGPLVYVEDEDAINKAKEGALKNFGSELVERLTALR